MSAGLAFRALSVWAVILALAVGNGAFREAVLIPILGTAPGLIVSGVILSALIVAVAWLFLPWLGVHTPAHLILIGFGWLVLTLVFEFSFGLFRGQEFAEILDAYTFKGGNIWPVVLVVVTFSPWLAAKLRKQV